MTMDDMLRELRERKARAAAGGGPESIRVQHGKGKLTARERIDALLDAGSFVELNALMLHRAVDFGLDKRDLPRDGVITGCGTVDGRLVYLFSQDFTVMGGSLGEVHAAKICHVMDQAVKMGAPIIGLADSGGARIQEGVDALKGYGEIFRRNTLASGVVPQITAIMGPCAGGAVYSPALGDFVLMTEGASHMFITGPQVVRTVLSQEVTFDELGGACVHAAVSGVAHLVGKDDVDTLRLLRQLLGYLPLNNLEDAPALDRGDAATRETPELRDLIPVAPTAAYHAADVVTTVLDGRELLEIQPRYAPNMIVGFGRLDGKTVGVVANNPKHLAGVLDIDSSDKAARFVRFCDAFNIPIVTFVDTPGYMPGTDQEHGGIIRHGAKLLYAYSEATVPLVTVIVRKAYGGAYLAMASKHLGADTVLALPTAEVAVMGPKAACEIIFRKEIRAAADPEERIEELIADYRKTFATPYMVASRGYVDDVVDPAGLRIALINSLRSCRSKRDGLPKKKHGNMPV